MHLWDVLDIAVMCQVKARATGTAVCNGTRHCHASPGKVLRAAHAAQPVHDARGPASPPALAPAHAVVRNDALPVHLKAVARLRLHHSCCRLHGVKVLQGVRVALVKRHAWLCVCWQF